MKFWEIGDWEGGMTLAQVKLLERTFAVLKDAAPAGPVWVIPHWIYSLKDKILRLKQRDSCRESCRPFGD